MIKPHLFTRVSVAAILTLPLPTPVAYGEEESLSVEHTIASAYLPVLPKAVFQHANSDARPAIREMFDGSLADGIAPSTNMVVLLGVLGTAEDLPRLQDNIERLAGKADPGATVSNSLTAIGRMAYRGIPSAKEALATMADKGYWANLGISSLPEWLYAKYPQLISVNASKARYLLLAADRAPLPSAEELFLEMYPEHGSDAEARKRFIYQIATARKSAEGVARSQSESTASQLNSETRKQLDWAYETFHLGKAPGGAADAPRDTPERAPETAEEMMVSVVRPDTPASPDEKARFAALAAEARDAFLSFFADRAEKGDYDAFKGRLLDDGRPQVPRLVEKHWDDIRRELEETQAPVFSALRARGLTPDAGQYTAGQAEDGSYIVTMPIPNSGALVEEHWMAAGQDAQLLAEGFAISDSLELVLVMRKIGDVWYWNPFGW